jgi:hypothetical protein
MSSTIDEYKTSGLRLIDTTDSIQNEMNSIGKSIHLFNL